MANTCTTQMVIHANQSAIDWFEKLVDNYSDEDYIEQFGSDGKHNIDRIGCKWIIHTDCYRENELEYSLSFESAWYPPNTMIKNMVGQLQVIDKGAWIDGKYWDENFDPIGIFQCNDLDMWETDETSVDVDWDNEMYWEDEVEPAFEKLEL